VRATDGSVARTAVAVLLGLSSATLGGACASAPKYGVPATDEPMAEPTASPSASSAASGVVPTDPSASPMSSPEYGVPATDGPAPSAEPEDAAIYGIPATPSK
jgi:hypothetical protein